GLIFPLNNGPRSRHFGRRSSQGHGGHLRMPYRWAYSPTRSLAVRSLVICPPAAPQRRAARRGYQPARSARSGGGPLLDHLIRTQQQQRRDREAEGLILLRTVSGREDRTEETGERT